MNSVNTTAQVGAGLVVGICVGQEIWIDLGIVKIRLESIREGKFQGQASARIRIIAPDCVKIDRRQRLLDLGIIDSDGVLLDP